MRFLALALLAASGLHATVYSCSITTASAITWSTAAWLNCGGGYPNNGGGNTFTATIITTASTTINIDVPVTVGNSLTPVSTGPGTITTPGSSQVVTFSVAHGLNVGDTFTFAGTQYTVQKVLTALTVQIPNTAPAETAVSWTYRQAALSMTSQPVTALSTLTVNTGVSLTVLGDFNYDGNFTITGGGSLAINGAAYLIQFPVGPFMGTATFVTTNNGQRTAITANTGGSMLQNQNFTTSSAQTVDFENVDFNGLGAVNAFAINMFVGDPGGSVKYINCTYTNTGMFQHQSLASNTNIIITGNKLISVATGSWTNTVMGLYLLTMGNVAPTGSPTRQIENNDFELGIGPQVLMTIQGEYSTFTITGNLFNHLDVGTTAGYAPVSTFTAFQNNFFISRQVQASTNSINFVGTAGDTLSNNYIVTDIGLLTGSGEGQMLQQEDCGPLKTGTYTLTYGIMEVTSPNIGDIAHPCFSVTALSVWDHFLVLPSSAGNTSGHFRFRGEQGDESAALTHNTTMGDYIQTGGGSDGALRTGDQYGGFTNMITAYQNNMVWQRTTPGTSPWLSGLFGMYLNAANTANIINVANINNNAIYNGNSGTVTDASGNNPTSTLGWNGFRATSYTSFNASTINLGSGTNESLQGPRFADTTRNFATFDSAYLGNTATAWASGQAYTVGQIVSSSASGYYGAATINYRCVTAHTSTSSGDTGQPGVNANAGSTSDFGWRSNWEFATMQDLRTSLAANSQIFDGAIGCIAGCTYIQALENWVTAGYRSQLPSLWQAGSDGATPGAVDMSKLGPAMVGAVIQ